MIDQQETAEKVQQEQALTARQLYQNDLLLVLLKDRCHLKTLWICGGVTALPGGVFLFWWLWWGRNVSLWGIGNTLSVLLQTFLLFPIIFFIYLSVPDAIAGLFVRFKSNDVIGEPRQADTEDYVSFVRHMLSWMDHVGWTLMIMGVVVVYGLYRVLLQEPANVSPVPYLMRVCAIIIYLPLMYATGISVLRLLLAVIFTNRLFSRFELQIKPLDADGAGGLGAMESLLWFSVGIMLWEMVLLFAAVLARNLSWLSLSEMVMLGAIYVVLTPALLIGWLIVPHRMMVKTRDDLLLRLANEYQQAFAQSLTSNEYDTRSLISGTRRLVALKQRYDLLHDTFPIWPMEMNTLRRIGATLILPLLLPIITSLITLALHPWGFPDPSIPCVGYLLILFTKATICATLVVYLSMHSTSKFVAFVCCT